MDFVTLIFQLRFRRFNAVILVLVETQTCELENRATTFTTTAFTPGSPLSPLHTLQQSIYNVIALHKPKLIAEML